MICCGLASFVIAKNPSLRNRYTIILLQVYILTEILFCLFFVI